MTLNELRYIVALSMELNFGRAAAKCFVTQPALSAAVKKLEDELGVAIFDRRAGRVTITPIGLQVIEYAKQVLDVVKELKKAVGVAKVDSADAIRVHCVETVSYALFPSWLPILRERVSDFPFVIEETGHHCDGKEGAPVDADMTIACHASEELPVGFLPLYRERFCVLASIAHPISLQETVKLEDLKDQAIITLDSRYCLRRHLQRLLDLQELSFNFTEVGNLQQVLNHVIARDGIALLPVSIAQKMAKQELFLKAISWGVADCSLTVGIVWHPRGDVQHVFDDVYDSLRECYPEGVEPLDWLPAPRTELPV